MHPGWGGTEASPPHLLFWPDRRRPERPALGGQPTVFGERTARPYSPRRSLATTRRRAASIEALEPTTCTRESGEFSHATGTSRTTYPRRSARWIASTSKPKPASRTRANTRWAAGPRKSLHPHWGSRNSQPSRTRTAVLTVSPRPWG